MEIKKKINKSANVIYLEFNSFDWAHVVVDGDMGIIQIYSTYGTWAYAWPTWARGEKR